MKKFNVLLVAILALAMFAVSAQAQIKIGEKAENFSLTDINGKEQSLNGLKGTNGTLVIFLSAQCPVVKAYNERLNKIFADYSSKGISFIGINPNVTESLEWVKSHTEENYKFPMLIDKGNVIADRFAAYATPQIYFFDKDNKLIYNGGIDNDRSGQNITMPYLRDALDASLAGKEIAKTETKAIGCTIKRVEKK
jgi:peroxiredoxin